MTPSPIQQESFFAVHQDEIVDLAFEYWLERLCLYDGYAAQDLMNAVQEVCRRHGRDRRGLFLVYKRS